MNTSYSTNNATTKSPPGNNTQSQPASLIDYLGLGPVIVLCMLYIIIALFAIFGNGLVVGSFIRHRSLRTFTNYFVVSLAVADMLVGLISIPMWMTSLLGANTGPIFLVVYTALDMFAGTTSIMHLMVISLERVYAIMFPVRHRNTNAAVYYVGLVFVWLWPAVMCGVSVPLRTYNKHLNILIIFIAFFVLPLIVILLAYGGIWKTVRSRVMPQASDSGKRSLKRDMRVIVTIALVVLFFVISWMPFFIVNLVATYCMDCIRSFSTELLLFMKFMHFSNSAVNPIVYAVKIPEFRRAFRQLVGLCLCRRRNLRPRDHELFSGGYMGNNKTVMSSSSQ